MVDGVTHSIETFVTVTRAFTLTTSDGVFASETRTTTTETIVVTSFLTRQKEGRTTTILLTTSWETTAVTTHASLVDGVFVITGDPLVEETAGGPTTMIVDYEEDEVPTDEVPTDEVPTDEVPTDEVPTITTTSETDNLPVVRYEEVVDGSNSLH